MDIALTTERFKKLESYVNRNMVVRFRFGDNVDNDTDGGNTDDGTSSVIADDSDRFEISRYTGDLPDYFPGFVRGKLTMVDAAENFIRLEVPIPHNQRRTASIKIELVQILDIHLTCGIANDADDYTFARCFHDYITRQIYPKKYTIKEQHKKIVGIHRDHSFKHYLVSISNEGGVLFRVCKAFGFLADYLYFDDDKTKLHHKDRVSIYMIESYYLPVFIPKFAANRTAEEVMYFINRTNANVLSHFHGVGLGGNVLGRLPTTWVFDDEYADNDGDDKTRKNGRFLPILTPQDEELLRTHAGEDALKLYRELSS